ncbi:hypothetical protein Tco_0893014 [Tanacetum coccineum]|uniref:Uncharacterized protein n=1 Tax=Tanacetum coccineum TaxID=301880 RepID=A0ABQ5C989_9ASTR
MVVVVTRCSGHGGKEDNVVRRSRWGQVTAGGVDGVDGGCGPLGGREMSLVTRMAAGGVVGIEWWCWSGGGVIVVRWEWRWDDDGGSGVMMVVELWWAAMGTQPEERAARATSDKGDRVDPGLIYFFCIIFVVRQKIRQKSFPAVVGRKRWRWPAVRAAGKKVGERE